MQKKFKAGVAPTLQEQSVRAWGHGRRGAGVEGYTFLKTSPQTPPDKGPRYRLSRVYRFATEFRDTVTSLRSVHGSQKALLETGRMRYDIDNRSAPKMLPGMHASNLNSIILDRCT